MYYKAIIDEFTCDVCRERDGKAGMRGQAHEAACHNEPPGRKSERRRLFEAGLTERLHCSKNAKRFFPRTLTLRYKVKARLFFQRLSWPSNSLRFCRAGRNLRRLLPFNSQRFARKDYYIE